MKDLTNCICNIYGWMTNPHGLNLEKNELAVYSIIYGFTQDDTFKRIRISYFKEFLGISRWAFMRATGLLKEKDLIDIKKDAGKSTYYKANTKKIEEAVKNTTDYFIDLQHKQMEKYGNLPSVNPHKIRDMVNEVHQQSVMEAINPDGNKAPTLEETKKREEMRDLFNNHDWRTIK